MIYGLRLTEYDDKERERIEAGDPHIIGPFLRKYQRDKPFTPRETWLYSGWQQLGAGRQGGGMDGLGTIAYGEIQEWMDRSGMVCEILRQQAYEIIQRVDASYRSEAVRLIRSRAN